jgi:hypothetical protein
LWNCYEKIWLTRKSKWIYTKNFLWDRPLVWIKKFPLFSQKGGQPHESFPFSQPSSTLVYNLHSGDYLSMHFCSTKISTTKVTFLKIALTDGAPEKVSQFITLLKIKIVYNKDLCNFLSIIFTFLELPYTTLSLHNYALIHWDVLKQLLPMKGWVQVPIL